MLIAEDHVFVLFDRRVALRFIYIRDDTEEDVWFYLTCVLMPKRMSALGCVGAFILIFPLTCLQ